MARFQDVTFAPAGERLLGPITLDLPETGITAIIGPNGAGKTLFLSLAHGHLLPDGGTVTWHGEPASLTRQRRGFLHQRPQLLRRSVRGNLIFGLRALGIDASQWAHETTKALSLAGLSDRAEDPAAALSGGQVQRLAFARAMLGTPAALLLDEPGGSLDPAARTSLDDMIQSTAQAGTPVYMSTHDLTQAKALADHIVFLAEGRVAECTSKWQFFEQPETDAAKAFLDGYRI